MSRTRRRLPLGRHHNLKLFKNTQLAKMLPVIPFRQGMVPRQWRHDKRTRIMQTLADYYTDQAKAQAQIDESFAIHKEIYRNGSCRRQRIHGVRLTKRSEARSNRCKLKYQLMLEMKSLDAE